MCHAVFHHYHDDDNPDLYRSGAVVDFSRLSYMAVSAAFADSHGLCSLGGIRVPLQICLISFLMILMTSILFYYPLQYMEWSRILPLFDTSVRQLASASARMGFTIPDLKSSIFCTGM